MTFGDPWFLALLIPLALFVLWKCSRARGAVDGGSEVVLDGLPRTMRSRTTWLPALLLTLSAVFLIVALARPLRRKLVGWNRLLIGFMMA